MAEAEIISFSRSKYDRRKAEPAMQLVQMAIADLRRLGHYEQLLIDPSDVVLLANSLTSFASTLRMRQSVHRGGGAA